jgi:hypothetical protein
MEAMRNRPDIRKKMMEMQQGKGKESKEERREKKRLEKEVCLFPRRGVTVSFFKH